MSRFMVALCAVLITLAPRAALSLAELPDNFQRPDCHRHAINAIIGDLSFILTYGTLPAANTDASFRVRTHLNFVYDLLSQRNVSHLPPHLREARRDHLKHLREYISAGRFPRNQLYTDQNRPCFIDRDENICAVGYLVEKSAGREVAERINEKFQTEFLWRMEFPELDEWIADSGFSLLELCMIQPCYDPVWIGQLVQDSDLAPATVSFSGFVYDQCQQCRTRYVAFDFDDGTVWWTGEVNLSAVPVNVVHTYMSPGSYTVTSVARAYDCGGYDTETWEVVLASPAFSLTAVRMPGGPPYRVYLRTKDDIRLEHLSVANVEWGDGGKSELANWYADGDMYRTPDHVYAEAGQWRVTATHCYGGPPCTMSETASVDVDVARVEVETTTWGRIRSIYALGR